MGWKWIAPLAMFACTGEEPVDSDTDPVDPNAARIADIADMTGDATAGQIAWDARCESCHAGMAPVFADLSAESVIEAIIVGPESMPSLGGLADQEIADIAAYVASTGT